ncbi:MAG TPA: UvrB/UvrC motif-containing protein [Pirellulales bacterium]|nr:UvrB/UvrC motif-containing protein [Pirellulales bacterium]
MAKNHNIDRILRDWPYVPGEVQARLTKGADGREILQMRVEMGLLQMEVARRPDGTRPHGCETYHDYLQEEAFAKGDDFELTEEQCAEADREFVQFYHRRICWLALREFKRAAADAEHTLAMMDFAKKHSPEEEWTLSHEQYRPFVLFHRYQAGALAKLEESGPEEAISELNQGLDILKNVFVEYEAEEKFEEDELVQRLNQLKEALREHYSVGRTLNEQLADAIATEQYELAAKLRDELAKKDKR